MSADQLRCLVTGATGYIGGRLVPRLLESGFSVRALARNPDKLASVPWRNRIEVARGDLGDPESLDAAFAGIDVIYYLVHSMGFEKDFAAEERRAAQNVVTAARKAGVWPHDQVTDFEGPKSAALSGPSAVMRAMIGRPCSLA
jgi:uncharacterized protein YbjT (DUF2867 family)